MVKGGGLLGTNNWKIELILLRWDFLTKKNVSEGSNVKESDYIASAAIYCTSFYFYLF